MTNAARWRTVLAGLIAVVLTVAAWGWKTDTLPDAQAGLERSLASFAVARGLTAAVSVVEGTSLSVQPLGIGVTFTPGRALRPIADALEQFAQLMLAASIAFGAEILLAKLGAAHAVSATLTVGLLAWVALVAWDKPVPRLLSRLLAVLVIVRFAMPVAMAGSAFVYEHWMRPDYESATKSLDFHAQAVQSDSKGAVEANAALDKDRGLLEQAKEWPAKVMEWRKLLERLKAHAEETMRHFVQISVVFLLQTVVLPLLFIWGLWVLSRGLLTLPHPR